MLSKRSSAIAKMAIYSTFGAAFALNCDFYVTCGLCLRYGDSSVASYLSYKFMADSYGKKVLQMISAFGELAGESIAKSDIFSTSFQLAKASGPDFSCHDI